MTGPPRRSPRRPDRPESPSPAPSPEALRPAGLLAQGRAALLVFLACGWATALLYGRAARCGVLSDGWVLLGIGSGPFPQNLGTLLGYHIIPGTHLLSTILWHLFGTWEAGYQVANLAELAACGALVVLLARRLGLARPAAVLAGLLLIANASFYEVTFWPVVGNFQILAGILQIFGVLAALRAADTRRRWSWAWAFFALALAAIFTYEPAVTVLAAGVLAAALVRRGAGEGWRGMLGRSVPILVLAAVAFAALLAVKAWAAAGGDHTPLFLPRSLSEVRFRLEYLVRSILGIFLLRGRDDVQWYFYWLGSAPASLVSLPARLWSLLWLGALGATGCVVFLRSRSPATRLALLWFSIHVVSVSIATTMVSRLCFLAAIPASLLLGQGIVRLAEWVAGLLERWSSALAAELDKTRIVVAAALVTTLVLGARRDLADATEVYLRCTAHVRRVVALVREREGRGPELQRLALLDLPSKVVERGIGAYAFVNGTHELVTLHGLLGADRGRIVLGDSTSLRGQALANGSLPLSAAEYDALVRDPATLVLRYDHGRGRIVVDDRITRPVPDAYTSDGQPGLPWTGGAPGRLEVPQGRPLELPLALPAGGAWAAIRILRDGDQPDLEVLEGTTPRLRLTPGGAPAQRWSEVLFPLAGEVGRTVLSFRTGSRAALAGLWSFAPPRHYTPETMPFLSWWLRDTPPTFAVEDPVVLPVDVAACAPPCALVFEIELQRGGSVGLRVAGGPELELHYQGLRWAPQSLSLPVAGVGSVATLALEPRAGCRVILRSLAASSGVPLAGAREAAAGRVP